MDELARDIDARVLEVRGRAGVTDNRDAEAQIHGGPHRRINAHRGHHSGYHELIDPLAPQATFEVGAQECIRRLFDYNRLILGGSHSTIVLEPGGAGPQVRRVRFIPRVLDVHDRLGSRPEGAEHTRGGVSRAVAADQGMAAAREVVALDIDKKQCAGHNSTLPRRAVGPRSRPQYDLPGRAQGGSLGRRRTIRAKAGVSMFKTIAVGTDGTQTADKAVDVALDIAERYGARLLILSAYTPLKVKDLEKERAELPEDVQWSIRADREVDRILATALERARAHGLDSETVARVGDPADVICQLASEHDVDLLVIGNKGMNRRVLGSLPKSVCQRAPCSVVVAKTT